MATDETREFIIQFAQVHVTFRKVEIVSLAIYHGIKLEFLTYSEQTAFSHVRITPASKAGLLVERAILTKRILELWGEGTDYDELHKSIKTKLPEVWDDSYAEANFKFVVDAFHGKRTMDDQCRIIDGFQYLPLKGKISLKKPNLIFHVCEDFENPRGKSPKDHPTRIYFGKLVGTSSRTCVDKYDLKKRPYIGTTSMDAELTLITANIALCGPGKLTYDPFVGTGSFMVAGAHFGSMCFGSDIDGRQIRGKRGRNIVGNFKTYGLMDHFGDCFVSDLTNTPIRPRPWLDSIICDPPYGIREGLKVLGRRDPEREKGVVLKDGVPRHTLPDYIPPKRPYSFEAMMNDILDFAVEMLLENGRLCMWMPTANDDLETYELPNHPALDLLHVCLQDFGNWSRQLLCYRRKEIKEIDLGKWEERIKSRGKEKVLGSASELNAFRAKYFKGFNNIAKEANAKAIENVEKPRRRI